MKERGGMSLDESLSRLIADHYVPLTVITDEESYMFKNMQRIQNEEIECVIVTQYFKNFYKS